MNSRRVTNLELTGFEAVIMKCMVFWVVTSCGLEKADTFGGTYHFHPLG
jgi:hypothetical protein